MKRITALLSLPHGKTDKGGEKQVGMISQGMHIKSSILIIIMKHQEFVDWEPEVLLSGYKAPNKSCDFSGPYLCAKQQTLT